MHIVTIYNGNTKREIHGKTEKLISGNVIKGINEIDSFSFSVHTSNIGFNLIRDFQTLVSVYNTSKKRFEFHGRVLYSSPSMDTDGCITKDVVCESYFGFLCDSQQPYVEEQNWTVSGLLQHIIEQHNSQVEEYKHFSVGEVTVTDPNDNLYIGIQRENTWDTIKKKLIETLGGEIRFRIGDDGTLYIDYLTEIGEKRATEIKLSRNMKAITKESDPSAYITRLIPLGCKLTKDIASTDESGNTTTQSVESEERLDIASINDGKIYIDDEEAVRAYGIHVGYVEFDDVTDPINLLQKGRKFLSENNKVQIKYSVTALDLSLLGLDVDDFDVCNFHPIKNKLLGIDDVARIVKKNLNICEEIKSTIELGDSFKTLSDIQIEQSGKVNSLVNTVGKIESNYVTNQKLISESSFFSSLINQAVESILLSVEETYTQQSATEEISETIKSELELLSNQLQLKFSEVTTQINDIDGDLQSKFQEISSVFTFNVNGFTIGKTNSPYKIFIDDNEFTMTVNDERVLWFEITENGNEANIPEVTVTKRFTLFGYLIDQDENGNVNCEYIGGAQ